MESFDINDIMKHLGLITHRLYISELNRSDLAAQIDYLKGEIAKLKSRDINSSADFTKEGFVEE